jgi:hypothetical protein
LEDAVESSPESEPESELLGLDKPLESEELLWLEPESEESDELNEDNKEENPSPSTDQLSS